MVWPVPWAVKKVGRKAPSPFGTSPSMTAGIVPNDAQKPTDNQRTLRTKPQVRATATHRTPKSNGPPNGHNGQKGQKSRSSPTDTPTDTTDSPSNGHHRRL